MDFIKTKKIADSEKYKLSKNVYLKMIVSVGQ